MIQFYAMGTNSYDPSAKSNESLYINNFGYYRNLNQKITLLRQGGRTDFLLLYVANGEIRTKDSTLSSGDFYVYYPNERQDYSYSANEGSLYYWIHYVGWDAPSLLSQGYHSSNGRESEINTLFQLITDALTHANEQHSDYSISLLRSLCKLLSMPKNIKYPFSRAIALLEDVKSSHTTKELADIYGITPEHFIRSFKKSYRKTPAAYKTANRISYAKGFLQDTKLSIGKIAELCGYSDALYFARIFKKAEGISPSEYRRKSINGITS